jgi:tetratricopeptide (TPR) repeat protein
VVVVKRLSFTAAVVAFALVLSASTPVHVRAEKVSPDSAEAVFARANALYEAGDFDGAIAAYSALVERGVVSADLDYNLANSYYKVGAVGRAVLFYERARRLSPRDRDIAENLALARSLLRDRQFVGEAGWLRRAVMWPHEELNTRETFLFASFWYVVLMLALLALIFRESPLVTRVYPALSMVSPGRLIGLGKAQDFVLAALTALVLFGVTAVSAAGKYHADMRRPVGVVLGEEVPVYGGPSEESTLQFKIHEGTQVKIDTARRDWTQVRLPGGLSGWIRSGAVERI